MSTLSYAVTTQTPLPHVPTQRPPVARQPIWTRRGALVGHEYLYRSRLGNPAGVDRWHADRQDGASASVLRAVFEEHDRPEDGLLVFVNVTRSFLVADRPLPVDARRLVIEIVESVPGDESVVDGLELLRAGGQTIAIDDFTATPDQLAMLPHADYVKVDCRDLATQGPSLIDLARSQGALLIAERVETHELLKHCLELGFDLLQGNILGAATTMPI